MNKVELFECIRKAHFKENKSQRLIAKTFKVHRRTVRQAIDSATPLERKSPEKIAIKLNPTVKAAIDTILIADKKAPKKQRHTAERIFRRLVDEYDYQGALPTVKGYVGQRRRALGVSSQAFVPQVYQPGEEAEVDWYEAKVNFPWGEAVVHIFQMRPCFSGKEFHRAFPRETQQAFLEGHVHAFDFFQGVFHQIRYDNLTSAVKKVLRGRGRIETDRFIALRSHYLFDSIFCKPGLSGAHEKGGVEGGVGRFRRKHLVPIPTFKNFDALNAYLLACCDDDVERVRQGHAKSVKAAWDEEVASLMTLPSESFSCIELVTGAHVSKKSFVTVKTNHYSVPVKHVGGRVDVHLSAHRVTCWHSGKCVADHVRCYGKQQAFAALDHYLELLHLKPRAFAGSLPLAQAKANKQWPLVYEKMLEAFISHYGQSTGTQLMIDCLHLHRQYPAGEIEQAMTWALAQGGIHVDVIESLIKEHRGEAVVVDPLAHLPTLKQYDKPSSGVMMYDVLLKSTIH